VSPTPLQGLTDAQLEALRRLLAAALAASPELADGEALQLVALAETDAARRAARRPSVDVPDTPGLAPPPPDVLVDGLSRAVGAVRLEATSTTKWNGVGSILARSLGLPPAAVYVTSVGGLSRNISVRLAQSRRARDAAVAAVIWGAAEEPTHQAIAAASRACVEIPRLTLVFTIDTGRVDLAAIVAPPSLPAPTVLTLAYPNAAVILSGGADRPPSDA
jgi:hypothetical protein